MFPVSTFAQVCVIGALIVLVLRDQRHIALQRASLAGEMHAASEIQRMLAPAAIDTAPGLKIDVAFHPMRDVGGDFYLCRVLADGRQRALLGDVSGKGAAAAMAATLLLGAAAARDSDSPAALLSHLNRVLSENRLGGFATCLCADVEPNGTATLANAGHLPPYLAGREIELDSSIPLGILPESKYSESQVNLDVHAQLTLLSDGIVEARNARGELFGFDRTAAISTESAQDIAADAQKFGQEDDITVLALTRQATNPRFFPCRARDREQLESIGRASSRDC
jgi:serine phosphatase RsbU (regulator of sigma subunit)